MGFKERFIFSSDILQLFQAASHSYIPIVVNDTKQ